jgi:hypothetical protein
MTGSKLNKTQTVLCLKETNLMNNLSGVYFIKRVYMFWAYPPPIIRRHTICLQKLVLIVSLGGFLLSWVFNLLGISTAHHQEANCIFTKIGTYCLFRWLSVVVGVPTQPGQQIAI